MARARNSNNNSRSRHSRRGGASSRDNWSSSKNRQQYYSPRTGSGGSGRPTGYRSGGWNNNNNYDNNNYDNRRDHYYYNPRNHLNGGGISVGGSGGRGYNNNSRREHYNYNTRDDDGRRPRGSVNRKTRSNYKHPRGGGDRRRRNNSGVAKLRPIHNVSKGSIHHAWKKELGGLIRFYMNKFHREYGERGAMERLERIYTEKKCHVENTKKAILAELGVQNVPQVSLALESDSSRIKLEEDTLQYIQSLALATDGKGLLLEKQTRAGEGPAHSHEQWTNVIVPSFAIGKSYYFQVNNTTGLDLSCAMTIDDHRVARNVPIPAHSIRTIRPDNQRYFQNHKWVFQPAKRVKVGESTIQEQEDVKVPVRRHRRVGKRYNGLRPDYNVGDNHQRVSLTEYPDPTMFGWTFTGSVQASFVEFFEKRFNNGGVVKLDWYYTTATIKTTIHHPSTGRNQLFRNTVTPAIYRAIMQNPRAHTNRGYRDSSNRPPDNNNTVMMDNNEADEFEEDENNETMEVEESNTMETDKNSNNTNNSNITGRNSASTTIFYAKNDNYDFNNQGHANRKVEMAKLQQSNEYQAWQEAAKKEWACVHAKFYISLPKIIRTNNGNNNNRSTRTRVYEPEPLPEQTPVVDVKSSQIATLGTKFLAVEPLGNTSARKSRVRVERVNLNDKAGYQAAPVFESKLYYRAEDVLRNGAGGNNHDDIFYDDDDDDEEDMDAQETTTTAAAATSRPQEDTGTLEDYKADVLLKVSNWHKELLDTKDIQDEDAAQRILLNCQENIRMSQTREHVDHAMKQYWDWHQQISWSENTGQQGLL